jgi:hypothetical protein
MPKVCNIFPKLATLKKKTRKTIKNVMSPNVIII